MVEHQLIELKVIGSTPIKHQIFKNFIKKKIFKKIFKKIIKTHFKIFFTKAFFLKKKPFIVNNAYFNLKLGVLKKINHGVLFFFKINQKNFNTKSTFSNKVTISTFSIGNVLKLFKNLENKFLRRSVRGVKIFLNFLKSFLEKKNIGKKNLFVFQIYSIDYNLFFLKNFLPKIIHSITNKVFFLLNIGLGFTKRKLKKKKSIKKRLTKSILLNFLKKTKYV